MSKHVVGYAVFGYLVYPCDKDDLTDWLSRCEQEWWDQVASGTPVYEGIDLDDAKEWALNSGEVLRIEEE